MNIIAWNWPEQTRLISILTEPKKLYGNFLRDCLPNARYPAQLVTQAVRKLRKSLINGGPCKIRTCDQLVKSASVTIQAYTKQALATHAACILSLKTRRNVVTQSPCRTLSGTGGSIYIRRVYERS